MGRPRRHGKHFVAIDGPGKHLEVVLNRYDELKSLVARND
jgi:hypothetical protein